MNLYISDEDNRLDDEIKKLMQLAGETALANEFGSKLDDEGVDVNALPIDLSVSVVTYEEIQELNRDYRGIDKITDVLSFPQYADNEELEFDLVDSGKSRQALFAERQKGARPTAEDDEVLGTMLGDVVICYDRAVEQAEEYGTGIKRELIYLFVHSIFHLFGYDHMEEDEKAVMRAREEAVMEVVGL